MRSNLGDSKRKTISGVRIAKQKDGVGIERQRGDYCRNSKRNLKKRETEGGGANSKTTGGVDRKY